MFVPDHRPHTDLPSLIMVAVPSYQGPTEWHTIEGVPIVPFVPSVARWESKGKRCSRKQFPLRLAYAQGSQIPIPGIDKDLRISESI